MLQIIKKNQTETIDSREVAEMLGKSHADLMKMVNGSGKNIGIIPTLTKGNFPHVDYFIESTYTDVKNEVRPCYLVTKLGCEMLGTRLQGEKGILFTASYVKRFNDMEKQLTQTVLSFQIEDPIERAKAWIVEQENAKALLQEKNEIIEELSPLALVAKERMDNTGCISITDVTKSFSLKRGQLTCWAKVKGYLHKQITEVNAKGEEFFKTIVDSQGHKAITIKEEGLRLIDKNIEEIKVSPARFNMKLVTE